MDITIRIVLRLNKANAKGEAPVALCINHKRKRHYHSLRLRIPVSVWDGTEISRKYPNADLLNAKLQKARSELERALLSRELQGEVVTLATAVAILSIDKGGTDFLHYALTTVLPELKRTRSSETYRIKTNQFNKLCKHRGGKKIEDNHGALIKYSGGSLLFGEITPVFLTKYYKYLTLEEGSHNNTTIEAFKFIKQVFNYAKSVGVTTLYPFSEWKMPKYEQPNKLYLTLEECMRIYKILEKPHDVQIKKVTAFFLVECFAGIRVSDWGKFSIEKLVHDEALKVSATKTGEPIYLSLRDYPILSKVIAYIAAEGLRFDITPTHARRLLKVIAPLAGIAKDITTHVGRHTCATLHLEKGFTREYIADLLGVSIRIVDTYAKITRQKHRNESARLGGF